MLKAAGITAEYNPFHNGHAYHVRATKRLTSLPVIAVMSGSFTQRGESAFLDKWTRARLAVLGGVDLVLELPACFTLRSAEFFARGAAEILAATGCVSCLSCGAEHPELDFASLAEKALQEQTVSRLKALMRSGLSYAAAVGRLLGADLELGPNDILALEYTKALKDKDIRPLYIRRQASSYNSCSLSGALASARAIRRAVLENIPGWEDLVPEGVASALKSRPAGADLKLLGQLTAYRLRLLSAEQISASISATEGLEYVLKRAARASAYEDILAACSTKRYPLSRIRRLLLQLLLGFPREFFEETRPAYLRVLAFNDTGRKLLREMKTGASLPVLTTLGRQDFSRATAFARQLELETASTDLWSLLQRDPALNTPGLDYLKAPVYVRKEGG